MLRGVRALSRRTLVYATIAGPLLAACRSNQPAAQAPQAQKPPVTITFAAHGDQSWQEFWNKVVGRFNARGGRITAEFHSEPDPWNKYVVLMAGGTMYDTFRNEEKRLPEFVGSSALLDLTDFARKDKEANKDDFPPTVWDEFFWNGRMYGFGHDLSPAVIFYNRRLFRERGLPLPPSRWGDPAWNWSVFVERLKQLSSQSGSGPRFGLAGNTWWVYQHPWVWANGGSIVTPDQKTVVIDQPVTVEALEYYANLRFVHGVLAHGSADLPQGAARAFEESQVAMYIDNTSYTIRMRQLQDQFDWEMAPYPTGKAGAFTRVPNNLCSAWTGTKYPEESWEFLKFMASKEATWDARGVPSRISAANSQEFLTRTANQNWGLLRDAALARKSEVLSPYFNYFDRTLNAAWGEVLNGQRPVKEMATELRPRLQRILNGEERG